MKRRRKSDFIIWRDEFWWVDGYGWDPDEEMDKIRKTTRLGTASLCRSSGPRTLKRVKKIFDQTPAPCSLRVLYRRKKGWICKWSAEK